VASAAEDFQFALGQHLDRNGRVVAGVIMFTFIEE
jgi:hypothetical protein